jgi:2'-5' RNA ligase
MGFWKIGNLIRGEAAEFYKATCADLAARFGIADVSEIVPPHITVKSPFEHRSYDLVERVVSTAASAPALPLTLSGWNHFGTRTIFIDIPAPTETVRRQLTEVLDSFRAAGVEVTPLEYELHMHLSVARFLRPDSYAAVSAYLATIPAPKFDISLDNLTIFTKDKEARNWKAHKTFPLTGHK